MAGYNITCDPGALGMQKCYTTDPTTGAKQEIIGYTSSGDPISKGASTSPWMAWVPTLTTLDLTGTAYQPYGEAGIPYTLGGGLAGVGSIMPSGGADLQDWKYLDQSMPGAYSRKMYQERLCNPLWSYVFGCRTSDDPSVVSQAEGDDEELQQIETDIPGQELKPQINTARLAVPIVVIGATVMSLLYDRYRGAIEW